MALVQRMCAWDRCGGWRVDWDHSELRYLGAFDRALWGEDVGQLNAGRRQGQQVDRLLRRFIPPLAFV